VAGHVGMQVEALGGTGGSHPVGHLPGMQVDVATGRITEGVGDRRDRCAELGRREGCPIHPVSLPNPAHGLPSEGTPDRYYHRISPPKRQETRDRNP